MELIEQRDPITIVGIEKRTSNAEAFTDIPAQWQKFFQNGTLDKIPNKVSADVYAVYTNFANPGRNNDGVYSFVIGAQVSSTERVPADMTAVVVPASKRRVFTVAKGHPEKVGEKWQEIWQLSQLKKSFLCDYERYQPGGEIEILVGVQA